MLKLKKVNKCLNKEIKQKIGLVFIIMGFCIISFCLYEKFDKKSIDNHLLKNFYKEYEITRNEFVLVNKNYHKISNSKKDEYIAILKIPKINLERGLFPKTNPHNNIQENITILKESAMPSEPNGNLILASHSGNASIAYFKNLYKLRLNDNLVILYNGYEYKYKVVNIYDVNKSGEVHILRNANKKTLTLITCRPKTDKQMIIIGELIAKK